ncbi:uncharacterized protein A4U43_C04F13070 [Asparagus officinalis]|uniref:Uncharacterized protein n=1 Tax=Asparagus officinalis TaxID=4686 RepID=A0A5P1F151_ASPOF|nr:uncharacterized protein LOC109837192 [Asparagus officinalis]ONK71854.1 uncharacterized protein A4U43_C04F13070 [Asparagus officinalis]
MAGREQRETLTLALGKRRSTELDGEEDDEDERDLEELEREVKEMAEKILECRRTMPGRIFEALSSHLVAQRPLIPDLGFTSSSSSISGRDTEAGTSRGPSRELRENDELIQGASLVEADAGMLEKLQTFRDKTASNVAQLPVILKRMNECIARLDRIDKYDVNLHSAFKRKRK